MTDLNTVEPLANEAAPTIGGLNGEHNPEAAPTNEAANDEHKGESQPKPVRHKASVWPRNGQLSPKLVKAVKAVEDHYGAKVFLFVQDDEDESDWGMVSDAVYERIARAKLPKEPVILMIHSLGGQADVAYQIVMALRHKCGGFRSFVPVHAKSAATLLAMGGEDIIMPPLAHLGPIDAQVFDYEIVGRKSALEVVQAVERLRSEAMDTFKLATMSMYMGTRLPMTTVMPLAVELTSGLMRPLLDHVDVNQYTRMSRTMKIGEEYAVRIMESVYGQEHAKLTARHYAQNFPEHGFVICAAEAAKHLHIEDLPTELEEAVDTLSSVLGEATYFGLVEEIEEKT